METPSPCYLHQMSACPAVSACLVALTVAIGEIASAAPDPKTALDVKDVPLASLEKGTFAVPSQDIQRVLSFQDRNGQNLVAFVRRDQPGGRSLQLIHTAAKPSAKRATLRTVNDQVSQCEFDVIADFIPASVQVFDEDGDGVAELYFAYRVDCVSDVSPVTQKLVVLEGGQKHILRGTSRVDTGTEKIGGEHKSEGFEGAKPLLARATLIWESIKNN